VVEGCPASCAHAAFLIWMPAITCAKGRQLSGLFRDPHKTHGQQGILCKPAAGAIDFQNRLDPRNTDHERQGRHRPAYEVASMQDNGLETVGALRNFHRGSVPSPNIFPLRRECSQRTKRVAKIFQSLHVWFLSAASRTPGSTISRAAGQPRSGCSFWPKGFAR